MEVLNTNIVLDFDLNNPVRFYTLNISVNDSELLDYLTVNVELVDINDNTPIFTNDSYRWVCNDSYRWELYRWVCNDSYRWV